MLAGTRLFERAAAIQLVIMDVDGVLTDGKIIYTSAGDEIKSFNVKDGLGISLAIREGIQFGIITARESPMVLRRAEDLNIQHVIQKTRTKLPAFEKLVQDLGLQPEQVAYIGDDLPDIPPMQQAGLACCPGDAAGEVKAVAHLVSNHRGGDGAVREILEFILESRQLLAQSAH
jgi:3-deoxy-D-manno-octulosonate 8-phosphate phosphatase (KDO 8-P phosphatase)